MSSVPAYRITPQEFDLLKVENFYTQNVPIEFSQYTTVPDSLLIFRLHADLTYTQTKVLEYLHKVTLGYLQKSEDFIVKHTAHLPFSKVMTAYGSFDKAKSVPRRSRFYATTEREIARNIHSVQARVHQAIEGLEEMKVIQKYTRLNSRTNYGINYHTLQGIFGGYSAVFQSASAIERAKAEKLIEFKRGKIKRIIFCIENFYAALDRKTERTWDEIQGPERVILQRLFPNNDHCH